MERQDIGRKIGSVKSSVSLRLGILIAAAFVPVVAVASIVAWQNYLDTTRLATESVELARRAVTTRAGLALSILRRTIHHISVQPPDIADPKNCDATLQGIVAAHERLMTSLVVISPSGQTLCSGVPAQKDDEPLTEEAKRWWPIVSTGKTYLLDSHQDHEGRASAITGVAPIMRQGAPVAMVVGSLSVDMIADIGEPDGSISIWLIPHGGHPLPLGNHLENAQPKPALFDSLAKNDRTTALNRSRSGDYYVYSSGPVSEEHRLIIGRRSNDIHEKARAILLRRGVEIGLFTIMGLIAILVGGNIGIARPIKRLHREVERWQRDGNFDPAALKNAPLELGELGESFRSATASLTERALQLRMAAVQQELLMQEIHHRVKNNLQIVASLLNLQASRITLPEAQAEFQSARDRVRALATLHRHLYSHGELNTINMRSFLTELCEQLFSAMGQQPGQRIKLDIDAPELEMSSDQAVPLALIITETVSNALKYAFPDQHKGNIAVKLVNDDDAVVLTVQDDGVGLPDRTAEPAGRRSGIGIQLIKGFVRQLGATMRMQEGNGTRYEISMKLQRARDVSLFVHNALARSGVEQT